MEESQPTTPPTQDASPSLPTTHPEEGQLQPPDKKSRGAPSKVTGSKRLFLLKYNDDWIRAHNKSNNMSVSSINEMNLEVDNEDPPFSRLDEPLNMTDDELPMYKSLRVVIGNWYHNRNTHLLKLTPKGEVVQIIQDVVGKGLSGPPRRQQAIHIFYREHKPSIEAERRLPCEPAEVQRRFEQQAEEETRALNADWDKQKEIVASPGRRSPEEYQRAIKNVGDFQSILSALCEALGLNGYLFLTGPMPRYQGECGVITLHHGKTIGLISQSLKRSNPEGYETVATMILEWGTQCFTKEEMHAQALSSSPLAGSPASGYIVKPVAASSSTSSRAAAVSFHPRSRTPSPPFGDPQDHDSLEHSQAPASYQLDRTPTPPPLFFPQDQPSSPPLQSPLPNSLDQHVSDPSASQSFLFPRMSTSSNARFSNWLLNNVDFMEEGGLDEEQCSDWDMLLSDDFDGLMFSPAGISPLPADQNSSQLVSLSPLPTAVRSLLSIEAGEPRITSQPPSTTATEDSPSSSIAVALSTELSNLHSIPQAPSSRSLLSIEVSEPSTTSQPSSSSAVRTQPPSTDVNPLSTEGRGQECRPIMWDRERWPKFMLEGIVYMWGLKLGPKWRVLVSLYVEMERRLGFMEKGPGVMAPGIPDAIKKWKASRCPWSNTKAPFSENSASAVQDHISKWTAWWMAMQPSARLTSGGALARVEVSDVALLEVVDDVEWVLQSMISTWPVGGTTDVATEVRGHEQMMMNLLQIWPLEGKEAIATREAST
ncbi:hypothetical protein JAAARDRAFT_50143 [Jaapia argillacea MUCL 33604]|uniref:Uncharacterized protein n=1 Tax=Jaapia argillacea MUCL 33604 TaxID=933084 RepID=A0A067PN32_9AGAM|nr:hypothetical protein JAAARDRAFT_50143 [Jaapia argillacea MUCL 33604]